MNDLPPKAQAIQEGQSAWSLLVPALLVLVALVSIVLLGLVGEAEGAHEAQAREPSAKGDRHALVSGERAAPRQSEETSSE